MFKGLRHVKMRYYIAQLLRDRVGITLDADHEARGHLDGHLESKPPSKTASGLTCLRFVIDRTTNY